MLVIHSMDRLARSLDDLRRMVLELTAKGVHVQFVKENMTFTGEDSPMSHLLLSLLGAVAEFERSMIRERQRVTGDNQNSRATTNKIPDPTTIRPSVLRFNGAEADWSRTSRFGGCLR